VLISDEVDVVERTDAGGPELLKLFVDAFLEVAKRHVQLDVV
jgi:hypothetical protein